MNEGRGEGGVCGAGYAGAREVGVVRCRLSLYSSVSEPATSVRWEEPEVLYQLTRPSPNKRYRMLTIWKDVKRDRKVSLGFLFCFWEWL